MSDLTVFCVCVGTKYDSAYVYALKEAVEKYLTVEHEFKCITTRSMPGIKTVLPYASYQSWWSKLNLFAPTIARGPSLYFDLDVAICNSLDYLVEYTKHQFAAPTNWAQSGHGGIQSSVMAWKGGWTRPFDEFRPRWPKVAQEFYGDQEFLWDLLGDDWAKIPGVCSYKYHCRKGVPKDASVICFHGEPKNLDVHDQWILPHTSILRKHISASMPSGGRLALSATG